MSLGFGAIMYFSKRTRLSNGYIVSTVSFERESLTSYTVYQTAVFINWGMDEICEEVECLDTATAMVEHDKMCEKWSSAHRQRARLGQLPKFIWRFIFG